MLDFLRAGLAPAITWGKHVQHPPQHANILYRVSCTQHAWREALSCTATELLRSSQGRLVQHFISIRIQLTVNTV